jgi:hypothetical protein
MSPACRFPVEPSSAQAARHFVRVFLYTRPAAVVDTAVLVTSELVTNALVHAHSAVEVELTNTDGLIRIAVTGDSSELSKIEPSVTLSEHGRRVPLVTTLSDDWGVDQTHFGKTIWFTLNPPASRRHLPLDKSSIKQGPSSSQISKTQRIMGDPMSWGLAEAWETNAAEWVTWASKPDHDAFWTPTWPELRAVLGRAGLAITEMSEYGNRPVHGYSLAELSVAPWS